MSRSRSLSVPFLLPATVVLALGSGLFACAPAHDDGHGADATEPAAAPAAEGGSLVLYSGRNKSLVQPLLDRFEEQSGIAVSVRYGETPELAATLLEEGAATPCDVFLAQDAAALGALAERGLLRSLPADVLAAVPPRFSAADGAWVGLSGRARVVVYNTERITPDELPQSLEEIADPRFEGSFGVAPANGSFQAHMAAYRAVEGADALAALLAGLADNEPRDYPKNGAIVEAVIRGEVDWGLVNHYYLWRALAEDPDAPAANFWMPEGSVSSFLNLAGAGVLSERPEALALVRFLVSDEAQRYFAEETFEYPLVAGVAPSVELVPLADLGGERIDFARLGAELAATQEQIVAAGVLK